MKEPLVLLPVLGVATLFKTAVFAEGLAIDPALSALIGNLGVIGVLIWHLWYHTTKAQPEMLRNFTAALKEGVDSHEREQKATREFHAKEMAEMRVMFLQALASFRTAVHDVKDTAQVVVTRTALADERAKQSGGN